MPETGYSSHSDDNEIKITCDEIIEISYLEDIFMITEGQPASPPPRIVPNYSTWTVTLDCGRKKSAPVAEAFVRLCAGEEHLHCFVDASNPAPDELNFFFGLSIRLQARGGTMDADILFGQGSFLSAQGEPAATNNWWIGSPHIGRLPSSDILLPMITRDENDPILARATTVFTIGRSGLSPGGNAFTFKRWF